MAFKIILVSIFLAITVFVSFRFGLFGANFIDAPSITEFINIPEQLQPLPSITATSSAQSNTSIKLLEAPPQANTNQKFAITWFIDSDKVATISHTAVHFGKTSKPEAQLPSDYPEKSAILKGPIPATFSAQLSIGTVGLYYYRAHAIVDDRNIWSDENTINIVSAVQSAATASALPSQEIKE